MKREEISLEIAKQLEQFPLPERWTLRRIEMRFEREGMGDEWASLIWDDFHSTFYLQTNKATVYPEQVSVLTEGIELMGKVNKAVKIKE